MNTHSDRRALEKIDIVLVVAVAENGVIGRDNALPWRLKSDMQHFRRVTMHKPVIMGRKTYLSIGKPLSGRTTIVLSRDPGFAAPGVAAASQLGAALDVARADALRRGTDVLMIVGGADVFRQSLPLADRLVMTIVRANPAGDIVFPKISEREWRQTARTEFERGSQDDFDFAIVDYERAR